MKGCSSWEYERIMRSGFVSSGNLPDTKVILKCPEGAFNSWQSCSDPPLLPLKSHKRAIPSEAVMEPYGHRLQFASWSNILLISILPNLANRGRSTHRLPPNWNAWHGMTQKLKVCRGPRIPPPPLCHEFPFLRDVELLGTVHSPDRLSEWNRNSNLSLLHWFSNLSKLVPPAPMLIEWHSGTVETQWKS